MCTGMYSTGADRRSGIGSIICKWELFTETASCAVEVLRNVQHHPYENMVEGFSRIAGCLCKYLVLNTEKLLEINSGIAIRIGDNCLPAYQMC